MPPKTNPVALVTGASGGIGYELAREFASHDHDVILVADHLEKLQQAAAELRGDFSAVRIEAIQSDLSQPEAPQQVYDAVRHLGWPVEVLVNNAGVGVYGDFIETELKDELAMIRLNVLAVVSLTKLFARDMAKRGHGKILITSSVAGLSGAPLLTVYGATKAFDYKFALGLREELKEKGITVTALLPSETDTNFFHRAHMEQSKITKGKLADPARVAKDGFEALMRGDDHVASPFKAKALALSADILPDELVAHITKKQQEPVSH